VTTELQLFVVPQRMQDDDIIIICEGCSTVP